MYFRYSFNDHDASIANPGPGVLLLLSDEQNFGTTRCIAKKIANAYVQAIHQGEVFKVSI